MYLYTIRAVVGTWSHEWRCAHTLITADIGLLHFTTEDGLDICVHGEWMYEQERR
jgi:hypothetical protein